MRSNIKQLEDTCNEHAEEITRLFREIEDTEKRDEEERLREQKAHQDQVEYLKNLNEDYSVELLKVLKPDDEKWNWTLLEEIQTYSRYY